MNLEIIEKDYKVGNRLRQIIEEKVKKLDRYFPSGADIKIVCKQVKNLYKMEVSIMSKGLLYRSEVSSTENMYVNIDIALPKIERQIVKHKQKNIDKYKDDAFANMEYEFIEDLLEEPEESKIVKRKAFHLGKPITEEEAQMYLEMSEHNFYIYLNDKSGNINLIYKRNDGNYGNIDVTID